MSFLLVFMMCFGFVQESGAAAESTPSTVATSESDPSNDSKDATIEDNATANAKTDIPDATPSTPEPSVLSEIMNSGALGKMRQGGWFMWPILFMGIIAAGVIIERYRSLKMLGTDSSELRTKVQDLLQQNEIESALHLCDREQGPVPAILSAGLRKFLVLRRLDYDAGRVEQQVVKTMDDYSVHIVAALERHLPVLATVSSAAPMLGFLGTVSGMITSFTDIVEQMGKTNIVEAAAGGISEALLTTCFGLIVGIPAFVAFNYFTSVINRFVLEVEESATELIETVTLQIALGEGEGSPSAPDPVVSTGTTEVK